MPFGDAGAESPDCLSMQVTSTTGTEVPPAVGLGVVE